MTIFTFTFIDFRLYSPRADTIFLSPDAVTIGEWETFPPGISGHQQSPAEK